MPPLRKSRPVKVCVSADGYLKLNDSQFTTFSYDVSLKVKNACPLSGPSSGNFVVTINGVLSETQQICIVGLGHHSLQQPVSRLCRFSVSHCNSEVAVFIVFQFRQTAKTFRVMLAQSISTMILELRFGYMVHVSSTPHSCFQLLCSFNNYFVPAKFISAEEINCRSPPIVQIFQLEWKSLKEHQDYTSEVGRDLFK